MAIIEQALAERPQGGRGGICCRDGMTQSLAEALALEHGRDALSERFPDLVPAPAKATGSSGAAQ